MNNWIDLVKEINQIEYNIGVMLRTENDALLDEYLTDKQMIVLNLIRGHPAITPGEIAQRLNVSASAISQLLDALVKKEMLKRFINPNNRREIILALTPLAEKHFRNMEAVETAIIEKYYAQLTCEELLQLKAILQKLEAAVRAGSKPTP